MKEWRLKVFGRVQDVNFRYYVKKQVDNLGVKGFVKNLADGSVLTILQGKIRDLECVYDFIKQSPGSSQVSYIQKKEYDSSEIYDDFEIRM